MFHRIIHRSTTTTTTTAAAAHHYAAVSAAAVHHVGLGCIARQQQMQQRYTSHGGGGGGGHHHSPAAADASSHGFHSELDFLEEVQKYCKKKQTGVSLSTLINFAGIKGVSTQKLIHSAKWLHHELKIRTAKTTVLLDQAPLGLNLMPSVRRVRDWYMQSFKDLALHRVVTDAESEKSFARCLEGVYDRHGATHATLARGLNELKLEVAKTVFHLPVEDIDFSSFADVHRTLDSFYLNRIGMRTLIGQHLELHRQQNEPRADYIGLICTKTNPTEVVSQAIEDARYMCERQTGICPDVIIQGQTDATFAFIPSFIYYIVFELLKNSVRAVVEHHAGGGIGKFGGSSNAVLPPVVVTVAASSDCEDVTIKISDQGGGIPRSQLPKIWSYLYTTAHGDLFDEGSDFDKESPLAGLGVGLPLSRLYARYFGGDLHLLSMEGFGTDCYVHLSRLGEHVPGFEQGDHMHFNANFVNKSNESMH